MLSPQPQARGRAARRASAGTAVNTYTITWPARRRRWSERSVDAVAPSGRARLPVGTGRIPFVDDSVAEPAAHRPVGPRSITILDGAPVASGRRPRVGVASAHTVQVSVTPV